MIGNKQVLKLENKLTVCWMKTSCCELMHFKAKRSRDC